MDDPSPLWITTPLQSKSNLILTTYVGGPCLVSLSRFPVKLTLTDSFDAIQHGTSDRQPHVPVKVSRQVLIVQRVLSHQPPDFVSRSNPCRGLFIGNKFVDAKQGGRISVLSPSSGKEIAQVCCDSPHESTQT